jgi:hypothetical protein
MHLISADEQLSADAMSIPGLDPAAAAGTHAAGGRD